MTARVVIVHERFTEVGGSELVVAEIRRIFPDARLVAPIAHPCGMPPGLAAPEVTTSALQRLHRPGRRYAPLLPLLPFAMASARLDDADLVVSSHHAFAHRIRPPRNVPWISYVHTPARWMWDGVMRAGEGSPLGRAGLATVAALARPGDVRAAGRVGRLVANSSVVAERIERWWGRSSVVVPPPVDVGWYTPSADAPREDFFLLAGRLVPYKRPEIAVAAAAAAGVPLVVVGEGRARRQLEAAAGPGVRFLGRVDNATLRDLYRRCRALVFPGEEDFGIVPVEAMACGTPVLALDAGGARDTVLPGLSGWRVPVEASPAAQIERFADAMASLAPGGLVPADIRAHAERFGPEEFRRRFTAQVDATLGVGAVPEFRPVGSG